MDNEKIYIVNGYLNEHGDESFWIEEVFKDKKLAESCCIYNNDYPIVANAHFHVSEHEISTYDYGGYFGARTTIRENEFISFVNKEI